MAMIRPTYFRLKDQRIKVFFFERPKSGHAIQLLFNGYVVEFVFDAIPREFPANGFIVNQENVH